jgi:hypothetical protein
VARSGRAAIVIDDIASVDPRHVHGVEVRARAEALDQPQPLIRIPPERIVSWGLASRAVDQLIVLSPSFSTEWLEERYWEQGDG